MDFPAVSMVVISMIIAALLALIFKSISKNEEREKPLSAPALKACLVILGLTGAVTGVSRFLWSVIGLSAVYLGLVKRKFSDILPATI